ncbi:hypothetical protein [Ornithinimicrobium kibberense]|uniref:hypothetical protein n=1 Tax=Ornithinimicrobium kibberense TaxID=282060 RepID=UPI003611A878
MLTGPRVCGTRLTGDVGTRGGGHGWRRRACCPRACSWTVATAGPRPGTGPPGCWPWRCAAGTPRAWRRWRSPPASGGRPPPWPPPCSTASPCPRRPRCRGRPCPSRWRWPPRGRPRGRREVWPPPWRSSGRSSGGTGRVGCAPSSSGTTCRPPTSPGGRTSCTRVWPPSAA